MDLFSGQKTPHSNLSYQVIKENHQRTMQSTKGKEEIPHWGFLNKDIVPLMGPLSMNF